MVLGREECWFERFRRNGDPAALAALFDRTAPELLRVALHLTRDPHRAATTAASRCPTRSRAT